jgi:hypothetical protein
MCRETAIYQPRANVIWQNQFHRARNVVRTTQSPKTILKNRTQNFQVSPSARARAPAIEEDKKKVILVPFGEGKPVLNLAADSTEIREWGRSKGRLAVVDTDPANFSLLVTNRLRHNPPIQLRPAPDWNGRIVGSRAQAPSH